MLDVNIKEALICFFFFVKKICLYSFRSFNLILFNKWVTIYHFSFKLVLKLQYTTLAVVFVQELWPVLSLPALLHCPLYNAVFIMKLQ